MYRNPNNEIDLLRDELFVRWVTTSDPELDLYWNRWLEQHPEKASLVIRAKGLIKSLRCRDTYAMNEESYNKVLDNLVQFNHDASFVMEERRSTERRYHIAWVAAALLLLGVAFAGLYKTFYKKEENKKEIVQFVTKVVPKGVKTTLVLPDGTIVKLNSLSTLRYPKVFSATSREVFLTGQAFFNVTRNENSPFLVHTENFTTRVLGTSFDIRSYSDEKEKHVAVVTGKVMVATITGLSETLTPDEMTIYKNNKMTRTSGYNHDTVLGWKDGFLEFKGADFFEVTDQLSRWYGVDFRVEKGLKIDGKYTGEYRNESLENVLKGIAFSSDFEFTIEDKIISITKPKQ
ncbi:MAG TPA: FecR domain-containing protein [Cyclobacteriaceae bacterium]|nr:FecR domain-containing protein [Cyclobacteriaceae bacterium]